MFVLQSVRQGDSLYKLDSTRKPFSGEHTFKTVTLAPGLDVVDKKIIARAPLSSKQSCPERGKEQAEREDAEPGNAHQSTF